MGEHSQRQGYLEESRVGMTRLNYERQGRRQERGKPGAATRRTKVRKGRVTKMSGLYREEPLGERQTSFWAGEFRVYTTYTL